MQIMITGIKVAPSWNTLQNVIRQALHMEGRLTRIARPDGQSAYRALGDYALTFTPHDGDAIDITVTYAA